MKAKSRYEIQDVVARGGMGVVYRAQDRVMNRLVALKTIHDLSDPRAISMFQREWQDLASLSHPNIVEVFDVGEIELEGETRPYLVMPLLNGVTLEALIKGSSKRLTVERCVDIMAQTCRGLQAAHDRGIVHRDVKPSNIFVMGDDAVKIIDFGVAGRLDKTKTVGRKGTLLYMSPEQLEGRPVSAVSDIFSLAAVCYETLARRRAFEGTAEEEVVEAILRRMPPPVFTFNPDVNPMISQVIQKAMAKQPRHRFSSAREFAEMLQKAFRNEPIESLNPARIQTRLQRARDAFARSDFALASEIVGELEAEGHLAPEIIELKQQIERSVMDREIQQLLESARVREEQHEYPLALQKISDILHLNPRHTEALALKSRIDNRRTEADIEEWFRVTHQHLENHAYTHAREALQRILELRAREPRAVQMLAEVDRHEQKYVALRKEKEELYRGAVESFRSGELSAALSKAERVLELDKQAPETMAPDRGAAYQNFYNEIRSKHDSLRSAYAEARAQLTNRNYSAALAMCDEHLRKFPNHDLFQALRVDIEEQRRQALSARIAEIDHKVEAEPDLSLRVNILEEAIQEYPGEPHFERALQLTRHKRGLVDSIVAKARGQEERGQFGEAITQWETLQTIYPRYPSIPLELERLRKRRLQQERAERKRRSVEQVERKLQRNEFGGAREILETALTDFPDDAELVELGILVERGQERTEESQRLFKSGQEAYQSGRFDEATTLFRRAIGLDDRNPAVRSALLETLVRRAQDAHEAEPRAAEILLREALDLEPNHALAKGLLSLIEDERRIAQVERCLSRARQLQNENDLNSALNEVDVLLRMYPDEERLIQLRGNLKMALGIARRHDLEEARRIERDVTTTQDLESLEKYSRRLETIVTRYQGDAEFEPLIDGVRKRLEPLTESMKGMQEPPPPPPPPPSGGARNQAAQNPAAHIQAGWLRSPWVFGVAGAVALALGAAILLPKLHKKPTPPVVVQVAREPEPAVAPAPQIQRLLILGTGKLGLDGAPQQDLAEVFTKEFPVGGEHSVKVSTGSNGYLWFTFTSEAGQPAALKFTGDQDVLALLVSTSKDKSLIYSNRRLEDFKIDGSSLGSLSQQGLALPAGLDEKNHKVEWREGQEVKSREIAFDRSQALTVSLGSDPNIGNMVVRVNVPAPVEIVVKIPGGKDLHGTAENGQWKTPLRAGAYTVEAIPPQGYEKTAAQQVTIGKGANQVVAMDFRKTSVPAAMLIATLARATCLVNGSPRQQADAGGKCAFNTLAPGHYKFTAHLDGYRDAEAERDLADNQIETLQLMPARLVGTVVLQKDPPNSVAFWAQQASDPKWEPFEGTSKDFPEGNYVFRAQLEGYNDVTSDQVKVQPGRSVPIALHLTAKPKAPVLEAKATTAAVAAYCAGWEGGEEDKASCLFKIPGFHAYSKDIGLGTVTLNNWSNDDRLKWQMGYRDDQHFWDFEMNGKSLKCYATVAKQKSPDKCNFKINTDLKQWQHMTLTVKKGELRLQNTEAKLDKTLTDPQYDFTGKLRVELRKQFVVYVQILVVGAQ